MPKIRKWTQSRPRSNGNFLHQSRTLQLRLEKNLHNSEELPKYMVILKMSHEYTTMFHSKKASSMCILLFDQKRIFSNTLVSSAYCIIWITMTIENELVRMSATFSHTWFFVKRLHFANVKNKKQTCTLINHFPSGPLPYNYRVWEITQ